MDKKMIERLNRYFATQPVTKVWVFGSFSRGEEKPDSDIDFMVALDETQTIGLKFFGMYEDLRQITGRNVDLVTESSLMPFARESAHKDRRLIYERIH
ncbi:MAG: nucleotidyltransferase family protein [Bacteroidales bacterium]|nr:nucleotidyltransferase family protein [Bacteroidales bacterium]